jgi:hypothetical protein
MSEALMKKNLLLSTAILVLAISSASCTHEWKDPNTSIPKQSISISNLVSNRQAFDSAGVSLIGKVWNLETWTAPSKTKEGVQKTYTTFILADRMGTGIDIYAPGEIPIQEGDFVRVIGIYRQEFQPTEDYFLNVVDAVSIEDWKPGLGYWIREFEFD